MQQNFPELNGIRGIARKIGPGILRQGLQSPMPSVCLLVAQGGRHLFLSNKARLGNTVLAGLYLRTQFTYARPAFELINIAFTYVRKQSLELIMLLRTHTPSGSN